MMNNKLEKIKNILLNDWDPIGISSFNVAQDEYDSYAENIYYLKNMKGKNINIDEYLCEIERYMGFTPNIEKNLKIAKKIDLIFDKKMD